MISLPKQSTMQLFFWLMLAASLISGCSGKASETHTADRPIVVTVTPVTSDIIVLDTQQFTVALTNASNTAVTWKVDGVQGGNSDVGVISSAGLYTSSAQAATRVISATSVEDPTKTASATITVRLEAIPVAITVSVTPVTASINTIQTQQFTATLTNASNTAVTWKVGGVQGGNSDVGVISSAGLYTPSVQAATRVISATSVEDPTKTASATITVQLEVIPHAITVSVTPATASINTLQTQQFTATLINASNTAVTWKVDGVQGGNDEVGVISSAGLYTPPAREVTVSITANSVQDPSKSSSVNMTVTYLKGVFTYHTDNARTGQNLKETVLTPSNVNTAAFGKLFSLPVDGSVYAQPLYAENVPVAGKLHNVVFVATEHNSVYAFDADNATGVALWQTSFIDAAKGITTVPSADTDCEDINPEIGITSTPVIDPVTGTLYVVAMTKEINTYVHRIHALDITTGAEKSMSGIKVQASVAGTAEPNVNGRVVFTSLLENQRTALLLSNNVIYFSTGSFCDLGDHHGWMFAYDAKTLAQRSAFNVTPNGTEGGIWQSGGGAAADANGNIYVISADGTFDANTGGTNYGSSFLKFAGASLTVTDYFTPYNQATLEAVNGDLGSGGALLLPDQASGPVHLLVSAGKQGTIYVLNRDNMGQFQAGSDSQIVQSIPGPYSLFSTPAYYKNTVYMAAAGDRLKAYTLNAGQLSLAAQSPSIFRWPGATAVISANESMNGIVWALETNGSGAPALLHAYEAANITNELYNSNQNAVRDVPGPAVKFAVPVVVNGKVYVGAYGKVSVFGLLP